MVKERPKSQSIDTVLPFYLINEPPTGMLPYHFRSYNTTITAVAQVESSSCWHQSISC